MLKNKLMALLTITTLGVSAGASTFSGISANASGVSINNQNVSQKSAVSRAISRISHGVGPIERNQTGRMMYQPLHNGNEIYVKINVSGKLANVYREAMRQWNSFKIVKLVEVNSASGANIVCGGFRSMANADAFTDNSAYDSGEMGQSHIYFTRGGVSRGYNYELLTARHELGHALGFAHDPLTTKVNGQFIAQTMYGGRKWVDVQISTNQRMANTLHKIYRAQLD